ncbi:MAG: serine/threonine protein kinase [Sphingomonadales bacterium]|nr:serine/threonine protein kinase [Sphingomonadales bacterium]
MRNDPPPDRAELDAALDAALDLPASEREAWLAREFSARPAFLDKLTRLLRLESESAELFDQLAGEREAMLGALLADDTSGQPTDPRIGKSYGPWKVVAHLGSGGLAEVYEVCRADGRYDQRAALKILRSGIIGPVARELFLRERRLLANLDQPGIVRIIDGGETPTGSPWLVMELAQGLPIDRYCEENSLPRSDRLALLAEAATIMSAAHASLVVHGDLKTDHVLVDPAGKLRLLDFGIAQALDEYGHAASTQGFTPAYASPEQLHGGTLSAASDIFQLGRIVAQVVPSHDARDPVGAIAARAMQADPRRRYGSMAELAADLRAVVEDRPVAAQPDTRGQALLRLVRQNRLAASLAVLALVGSAGWAATATLSAGAIARERNAALLAADREQRGKQVLLELFRRADLLEADSLGLEPTAAAAMLEDALADARRSLADDPAMLAELIGWTARAELRAGDAAKALALGKEALAQLRTAGLEGTLREGAAAAFLAHLSATAGEAAQAEALAAQAQATLGKTDPADPLAAELLVSLAWAKEGNWQAQQALFERALAVTIALGGGKGEIEIRSGLARALAGQGDIAGARREIGLALATTRRFFGERHPRLALPLSDAGRIEERAGNYAAAIAHHREALAISEAAFGPAHSSTLAHRNNLAIALDSAGQTDAAIAEYTILLDAQTDELKRGEIAQNLGAALVKQGDFARAERPLAIAEAAFARRLPQDHPRRAFPALTRSEMRLAQHRWSEAEADARAAFAHLSQTLPTSHFATETARCRVGIALIGQGKTAAAATYVGPALAALTAPAASVPARYVEPCRAAARSLAGTR